MYLVKFEKGKKGDLLAKINNKIAFIDKKYKNNIKEGEEWIVEISGQNPRKTVYFLRPIKAWEGTIEDFELIEAKIKENIEFARVEYILQQDGKIQKHGKFNPREYPEKFPILNKKIDEYEKKIEEEYQAEKNEKENAAKNVDEILNREIPQNVELEKATFYTRNYKIKIQTDEDFGRHTADPGYTVKVTPNYKGITEHLRGKGYVEKQAAKELFELAGLDGDVDDVMDLVEEDAMRGIRNPEMAIMDRIRDKINSDYIYVTVILEDDIVEEIADKYPDRDNKKINNSIEGYLNKYIYKSLYF